MKTELLNDILEHQREFWPNVMSELVNGKKQTHWCWYFIPNVPGLGQSPQSQYYALEPGTLLEFLQEDDSYQYNISIIIATVEDKCSTMTEVSEMLGDVDALKYRSMITLLAGIMEHNTERDVNCIPLNIQAIIRNFKTKYGSTCEYTEKYVKDYYESCNTST